MIADGKLQHLILGLNGWTVHYICAFAEQFRVEGTSIANPKEDVPRSSLLFVWADEFGLRHQTEHDGEIVPGKDGKLRGRSSHVIARESEDAFVVGGGLFD